MNKFYFLFWVLIKKSSVCIKKNIGKRIMDDDEPKLILTIKTENDARLVIEAISNALSNDKKVAEYIAQINISSDLTTSKTLVFPKKNE
jgi:hypothetical protein